MVTKQRVDGVDLSHWQGKVDLAAAKAAGLRWVVNKSSEGTSFADDSYTARRAQAAEVGLPFGAYHFARPEAGRARAEARLFLAVACPVPGDVRPTLDLEVTGDLTPGQLRRWAAGFVAELRKRTGVDPMIYGPMDLGRASEGCLLWRPRYNNSNTPPGLPWDIWQFSNGVLGVPNSYPGLGHVDLNTMGKGLRLQQLLFPRPKPPARQTMLHLAHISMQYRDSRRQHAQDVRALFARAKVKGWAWFTGTEAGPGSKGLEGQLREAAKANGYRFHKVPQTDAWICVLESLIAGGWEAGYDKVIPASSELGSGPKGRWGEKGLVRVAFDTEELGRIAVGVGHYVQNARQPGSFNWRWNKRLAGHIGDWAVEEGQGSNLVWYAGDQNLADDKVDTFYGEPLVSCWDELQRWEPTGHGNIDVIASYARDARSVAAYARALDDEAFPLNTDHFLVEAGYAVRVLR